MEIKEKYIDPFTDFGFKKIFGSEPNKDLLIDFLNKLLEGYKQIEDLKYAKNERLGKQKADRKASFDLYCTGPNGEHFIIELQRIKQTYFKDRSLYYVTFPIQDQAPRNQDWDYQLQEVIFIGVMEFTFEESDPNYRHEVHLVDEATNQIFYNKLKFIYLEMPKFNKNPAEIETGLDKWMYLLKNMNKFREIPEVLQEKIFRKVFNIAEIAHLNKTDMQQYEQSLKEKWDWYSSLKTAREEGEEKAIHQTAIKMIQKGADDQFIMDCTGLTQEEVDKLRKEQDSQ